MSRSSIRSSVTPDGSSASPGISVGAAPSVKATAGVVAHVADEDRLPVELAGRHAALLLGVLQVALELVEARDGHEQDERRVVALEVRALGQVQRGVAVGLDALLHAGLLLEAGERVGEVGVHLVERPLAGQCGPVAVDLLEVLDLDDDQRVGGDRLADVGEAGLCEGHRRRGRDGGGDAGGAEPAEQVGGPGQEVGGEVHGVEGC